MKKLIALVLTMVCVFSIVGCNNTTKDLQKKFPEYYNLDTFKGVEVYVWQTDEGEYRCGALYGTNGGKTFEEISNLAKNSATIEEMRIILASYDIPTEDISIFPIIITSSNYEFVVTDYTKIKDIFWGTNVLTLTIAETLPSCVPFEYREPYKPYCLYAYDTDGHLYRVLWTDWDGLSEKDRIVVEYSDIKEIDQTTNPSTGWNPKYEITATNVKLEHNK